MKPRARPKAKVPGRDGRRFSYYARLAASEKRTYRRSDAVTAVELPRSVPLQAQVTALEAALRAGTRTDVERAAQRVVDRLLRLLRVRPVRVKVRSVRPSEHDGELHGLYTWEPGKVPLVEVWMRTAQHRKTVAFRTFLRTLVHEVCHHLDFTLFGLEHTFHTEGFFRRESSLVRQLAGPGRRRRKDPEAPSEEEPPRRQLRLFA